MKKFKYLVIVLIIIAILAGIYAVVGKRMTRNLVFARLRPVALKNCELKRYGDRNDGGYLMCGNLMAKVKVAYSYGINGTDEWGCDVSRLYRLPVHQYDCINLTRTVCGGGTMIFHEECVGDRNIIYDRKLLFNTMPNHIEKNGDRGKRLVVKMDIEGSEWVSLMAIPDDLLERIDQLVVEFHGVDEVLYIPVLRRLNRFFHIAHVHFNNTRCNDATEPFPSPVYEVLYVNRRIGIPDENAPAPAMGNNPLDAPNNPLLKDCQTAR